MADAGEKRSRLRLVLYLLKRLLGRKTPPGDPFAYVTTPIRRGPKGRSGAAVAEMEDDTYRSYPPRPLKARVMVIPNEAKGRCILCFKQNAQVLRGPQARDDSTQWIYVVNSLPECLRTLPTNNIFAVRSNSRVRALVWHRPIPMLAQ